MEKEEEDDEAKEEEEKEEAKKTKRKKRRTRKRKRRKRRKKRRKTRKKRKRKRKRKTKRKRKGKRKFGALEARLGNIWDEFCRPFGAEGPDEAKRGLRSRKPTIVRAGSQIAEGGQPRSLKHYKTHTQK